MGNLNRHYRVLLVLSVMVMAVVANLTFTGNANASGNIAVNGGFETVNLGWTYTNVDQVGGWNAHGGGNLVDLNALSAGSISQSLTTVPGRQYDVNFWMSGNPACTGLPPSKGLTASAPGTALNYFSPPGLATNNLQWTGYSFSFTAVATSSILSFASYNTSGACGALIDDVSVNDPGPATLGRSPWQMLGNNPIVSPVPNYGVHGDPQYYNHVGPIPSVIDPGWGPAPNGSTIGFGGGSASRLGGYGCLTSLDYTFFQTLVDIPNGTVLASFTIEFIGMDDGSRITVYNSVNPTGLVILGSYVYLGATGTTDLASYMVIGETNRVVITQIDDCWAGNNLQTANVVLNGAVIAPPPSNVAPTIESITGSTIDENDVAGLTVVFSDDSGDTHDAVVDWGEGVPEVFSGIFSPFAPTHTYLDDNPTGTSSDSYAVSVIITDQAGLSDSGNSLVVVNNVAPEWDVLGVTSPIDEGGSATLTGSFTDVGTLDTHTVVIDWGDGNVDTIPVGVGVWTISASHPYPDDNPTGTSSDDYDVTVTLSDDDGGVAGAAKLGGNIFLTGHDPDFHAVGTFEPGAKNLMREAIEFVRNGSGLPMLWVESKLGVPAGHRLGKLGLITSGVNLVEGVDFVHMDAAELGTIDWSTLSTTYSAIGVASDHGGTLSEYEKDVLILHKADIATFVNAGGGLYAGSECSCHGWSFGGDPAKNFAFLPITVTATSNAFPPYVVTTFGFDTFGLVAGDVNSPSHSHFDEDFGLNVVSLSSGTGQIMTLAGNVLVTDTGISQGLTVTVNNVAPTGSIAADAFNSEVTVTFGDVGSLDTHSATVDWGDGLGAVSIGAVTSPFTDSNVYSAPGVYDVTVTVTDDDTGAITFTTQVIGVGDCDCTKEESYWKKQFDPKQIEKGNTDFSAEELDALLSVVNFGSGYFDGLTISDAHLVFDPAKSNNGGGHDSHSNGHDEGSGGNESHSANLSKFQENAVAEALAAWLNFAKGAIGWDELIDVDGDSVGDMTFGALIVEVESLLSNPDATKADLKRAKNLAEAVNEHDEDNPACDDDGDDDDDDDQGHHDSDDHDSDDDDRGKKK